MPALHRDTLQAARPRAAAGEVRLPLRSWSYLCALAVFGLVSLLPARSASAQSAITDLVTQLLKTAAHEAAAAIAPTALGIAISLAVIELVVFAIAWRDDRLTLAFPLRGIAVRAAWWSWLFLLIFLYQFHPPFSLPHHVIDGAEEIASEISGIEGFAPHAVIAQGWAVFSEYSELLLRVGITSFLSFGDDLGALAILALNALLILASYYIVALALYFLMFQIILTLAIGSLFLACGASRWTARLHDGYLNFVFSLAVKLILFALLLRIGDEITEITLALLATLATAPATSLLSSPIPITVTLATLGYAVGAMLPGPVATRLTSASFEIAAYILPQRES